MSPRLPHSPDPGQQTNGAWQYWHTDALGSLRALSDSSGQVIGTQRFTPFGVRDAATGALAPRGFTGEPQDALVYLRARFYHPALGRFLSADSLVPDVTNGQAWNAYAYGYNDPVNLVDPSGHNPLFLAGVVGAAAFAVGFTGAAAWQAWHDPAAYNQWWRMPRCTCSPPPRIPWDLPSRFIGNWGGPLFAAPLTSPVTVQVREIFTRTPAWAFATITEGGRTRTTGITRQPTIPIARTRDLPWHAGAPKVDVSALDRHGTGTWTTKEVGFRPGFGLNGIAGSVFLGGFLSGVGGLVDDLINRPCLSPQQLAHNALANFGYGLLVGAISTGAGMFVTALTANPFAGVATAYVVGGVLSEGVGWARGQGYVR